LLIEGIVDYTGRVKKKFIESCIFDECIESTNFYVGIANVGIDSFNKLLVASFNKDLNEVKSLSNFSINDLTSFMHYKQLLNQSDNKLRITAWYNEDDQTLFLSRELFGTIPFFYLHVPHQFSIFSTSLASLIKKKETKQFLDIETSMILAHQTFGIDRTFQQSSKSFYSNIKTVLPGHLLQISPGRTDINSFTHFNIERWDNLSTLEDYGSAVREIFQTSVLSSVKDDSYKVASHLSGGLDSSSVSTMFKHLYPSHTLHTLYHKSESKDMDESFYSQSVAKQIGSIHHEIFQSEEDFNLIKNHTSLFGEPEISSLSPSLLTTMMPYAQELGCNIILIGSGGDSVIGSGMEILHDSFQQKDWTNFSNLLSKRVNYFSLADQYKNWESYPFEKKYHFVLQNFLYRQAAEARKMPFKDLLAFYRETNAAVGISNSYFLDRGLRNFFTRLTKRGANVPMSVLRDDFIYESSHSSLEPILSHSLRSNLPIKFQPLFEEVFAPRAVTSAEQQFVLSEYYGVSSRSPFLDKELFELCMIVPDLIKYGDGKGREHLREAMKGLLPEVVRTRSTKATLASSHGQKITLRLYNQAQTFLYDTTRIWEYVDKHKFNEQVAILKNDRIPYSQKVRTWFHITRTISLALWLEWLEEIKHQ